MPRDECRLAHDAAKYRLMLRCIPLLLPATRGVPTDIVNIFCVCACGIVGYSDSGEF